MQLHDPPALALGVTVATYWACVGIKAVKVTRGGPRLGRVLVPKLWNERLMWVVWVPVVATWIAMPFVAPAQAYERHPWIGMPILEDLPTAVRLLRGMAILAAIGCLALSIKCWRYMGRSWRMGIDPGQKSDLINSGPFRIVRHPIYALSMTLMVCSVLIIPTRAMVILAVLHLVLLHLKARNEERFLLRMHGSDYTRYCARTPRFFPLLHTLRNLGDRPTQEGKPL
jgi:protein-S-isoprenylcysteine O-methyltransferase Ste14